jgi:hypothetical protein
MKPSVMLIGFVLGSAAAITFSLSGVAIVFLYLRPDYPRLEGEIQPLLLHLGIFSGLTVLAGLSFYAELKRPPWRMAAAVGLGLGLIAVTAFYWPD